MQRLGFTSNAWPSSASDVYVREQGSLGDGRWGYAVEVDGVIRDHFTSTGTPLTWSQMTDVQQGYAEAING